jgi:hypothetical protein
MADYPILPATLVALQATKGEPLGTEDAGKIDDVLRQTRTWMYDFLSLFVDSGTLKLKDTAFADGSLPSGLIRGSNPVGDVQREILQGSVRTPDLADAAVTGPKLANAAVSTGKLVDGSVTDVKIADNAVTQSKLGATAIGSNQLADNAVISSKIAPGAVVVGKYGAGSITSVAIGDRQVIGSKLEAAIQGQVLVGGNGAGLDQFAPKTLSGAMTIDQNGVVTLAPTFVVQQLAFTRLVEKANPGVDGGISVSATWNRRGAAPSLPWSIDAQTQVLVNVLSDGRVEVVADGVYLFFISSPAYRSNSHKLRLIVTPDAVEGVVYTSFGESAYNSTTDTIMNRTSLFTVVSFSGNTDTLHPSFVIDHYTAVGHSTGLGISTSAGSGVSEIYATVSMIRLL